FEREGPGRRSLALGGLARRRRLVAGEARGRNESEQGKGGIDEEGRSYPPGAGDEAAQHRPGEPAGAVHAEHPADEAAALRRGGVLRDRGKPSHQPHLRGEAGEEAQHQELGEGLDEGDGDAHRRGEERSRDQDDAAAEPVDEEARGDGAGEIAQEEGGDDAARDAEADAKGFGEGGHRRKRDAGADGEDEGGEVGREERIPGNGTALARAWRDG